MNITLLNSVRIAGAVQAAGTTLDVDDAIGASLVHRGDATNNRPRTEPVPVMAEINPVTGVVSLSAGGITPLYQRCAEHYVTGQASSHTPNTMANASRTTSGSIFAGYPDFYAANGVFVATGGDKILRADDTTIGVDGTINAPMTTGGRLVTTVIGDSLQLYLVQSKAYYRIRANGQYVGAAIDCTSGSLFVVVTLPDVGEYRIEVELGHEGGVYGIWCKSGMIAFAPKQVKQKITVLGDSTVAAALKEPGAATINALSLGCYGHRLMDTLGVNVKMAGISGGGYVNSGALKLNERIDDVATDSKAVIISLGANDGASDVSACASALLTSITAIKALVPYAPITVMGVVLSPSTAHNTQLETALSNAVSGLNDKYVRFYPVCGVFATGSGNAEAPAGNGSLDYLIGSDNTHHTTFGGYAYAKYVTECVLDHWSRLSF